MVERVWSTCYSYHSVAYHAVAVQRGQPGRAGSLPAHTSFSIQIQLQPHTGHWHFLSLSCHLFRSLAFSLKTHAERDFSDGQVHSDGQVLDMNKWEIIQAIFSHAQTEIDILRRCKNLWFSGLNIYKSYDWVSAQETWCSLDYITTKLLNGSWMAVKKGWLTHIILTTSTAFKHTLTKLVELWQKQHSYILFPI